MAIFQQINEKEIKDQEARRQKNLEIKFVIIFKLIESAYPTFSFLKSRKCSYRGSYWWKKLARHVAPKQGSYVTWAKITN